MREQNDHATTRRDRALFGIIIKKIVKDITGTSCSMVLKLTQLRRQLTTGENLKTKRTQLARYVSGNCI